MGIPKKFQILYYQIFYKWKIYIPNPKTNPSIKPKLVDPAVETGVEDRVNIVKWLEVIVWVFGFQDNPSSYHLLF